MDKWSSWFLAWTLSPACPALCYTEIRVSPKVAVLFSETLSQALDVKKISPEHVDLLVNKARPRSSLLTTLTTVDGRGWTPIVYYMSVDRNPLISLALLWLLVDLLYNFYLHFCMQWRSRTFGRSGRWSNLPPFRLRFWELESLFKV